MIFDKIENIEKYRGLHVRIDKVIDFLKENDLKMFNNGKHNVDSDDVYVNVDQYFTKRHECAKLEGHKKYIDLQVMLSGEEYIGYAPVMEQPVIATYSDDKDIEFYEGSYSLLRMEVGMFMIFFTNELHIPCLKVNDEINVRKAVFKIMER